MVKSIFHLTPGFTADTGKHPPPPPLPEYDPNKEAPQWDWHRWFYLMKKQDKHPDTPRRGGNALSDDKPDWRGVIKNNIVPLDPVEPYDLGAPQIRTYWFFDTPDYADPFKKLWFSFKWFLKTGGIFACCAAMVEGKTFCYKDNRYLFTRYMLPWLFGGMVFSAATVSVANLRGKKDDYYNYLIAGLIAGCATGRKNYLVHFRHTLIWTAGGVYLKWQAENNTVLFPMLPPSLRSLGLSGHSAEGGFFTGDLQLFKFNIEDAGRDARSQVK